MPRSEANRILNVGDSFHLESVIRERSVVIAARGWNNAWKGILPNLSRGSADVCVKLAASRRGNSGVKDCALRQGR